MLTKNFGHQRSCYTKQDQVQKFQDQRYMFAQTISFSSFSNRGPWYQGAIRLLTYWFYDIFSSASVKWEWRRCCISFLPIPCDCLLRVSFTTNFHSIWVRSRDCYPGLWMKNVMSSSNYMEADLYYGIMDICSRSKCERREVSIEIFV